VGQTGLWPIVNVVPEFKNVETVLYRLPIKIAVKYSIRCIRYPAMKFNFGCILIEAASNGLRMWLKQRIR